MSEASVPEVISLWEHDTKGRKVAEGILEAAQKLDTHPTQLHAENDPYVRIHSTSNR